MTNEGKVVKIIFQILTIKQTNTERIIKTPTVKTQIILFIIHVTPPTITIAVNIIIAANITIAAYIIIIVIAIKTIIVIIAVNQYTPIIDLLIDILIILKEVLIRII